MPVRDDYSPGEFCWVDLNAHDMEAAKAFYGQLFGWTAEDSDIQDAPPYACWTLNGQYVSGLGQMSDEMQAEGIPASWNCYIRVDIAEDAQERAVQAGGQVAAPVIEIPNALRMSFLVDPTGALFATWQPIGRQGAQLWGDPGTPCWCELSTRDIESAKGFYEAFAGWTCSQCPEVPGSYYMCSAGETIVSGLLQMTEEWGDLPPRWSVYFRVSDVDASCAVCTELGGTVCVPPFDTPIGRIAGCADAQGAFFYLIRLTEAE